MAAEHLIVVAANDFKTVRMVCAKCESAVTIPLNQIIRAPEECPTCKHEWRKSGAQDALRTAELIANAFKRWNDFERTHSQRFTIRFEISEP